MFLLSASTDRLKHMSLYMFLIGLVLCLLKHPLIDAIGTCGTRKTCWYKNDFAVSETIGQGSIGKVAFAVEKSSGYVVLLKELQTGNMVLMKKVMLAEIIAMDAVCTTSAEEENVIELYGYFVHEGISRKNYYMIIEPGLIGDFHVFVQKRLTGSYNAEEKLRNIARDMFKGIRHIHQTGYFHRDIKEENILLTTNMEQNLIAKIADFGLALPCWDMTKEVDLSKGTLMYIAPELWIIKLVREQTPACVPMIVQKADMFAAGLVLMNAIMVHPEFYTAAFHEAMTEGDIEIALTENDVADYYMGIVRERSAERWLDGWFRSPKNLIDHNKHFFSEDLIDLISRLLVFDPNQRFSAEQALVHPWFDGRIADKKMYIAESNMAKRILSKHHWNVKSDRDFYASFVEKLPTLTKR